MINAFCATLEARDPAQRRFRAYRIEAGTDLLGRFPILPRSIVTPSRSLLPTSRPPSNPS
jgi:hypothetical protein